MKDINLKYFTIDEYVARYPEEIRERLNQLREIILELAPNAEQTISYGVPTFKLNGKYFIYIAGFKNHTSIYPFPSDAEEFKKAVERYKTSKGTIQFRHTEPIPYDLVKKIVKYRIKVNKENTLAGK